MTSPPGRRRLAWKIATLGIGTPLFILAGFWAWMRLIENRKWSAMERRVAELQSREHPANPNRLPLHGPPLPGNAWEDYGVALAPFTDPKRLTSTIRDALDDSWNAKPGSSEAVAAKILAEHRPSVEALRQGARRATAGPPVPEKRTSSLETLSSLVRNTAGEIGRDRPEEAVDLLVDLLQFGIDLDAAADWPPTTTLEKSLDGLRRLLEAIPPQRRRNLDQVLLRTEQSLSAKRMVERFVLRLGSSLVTHPQELHYPGGSWEKFKSDWRYGYSIRHLAADKFQWMDQWASQIAAWEDLPYSIARERSFELYKEEDSCHNRFLVGLGAITVPHYSYREIIAKLRILRTACGARGLKDPYGDLIRTSNDGDLLRIWSIGRDGFDSGGGGEWADPNTPDIVLKIRR